MTNSTKTLTSYENATGSPAYGLTNDYMFRAVFQKSELARKGLIASILHMKPEDIKRVIITNPITLGEQIDDKEFILDIQVILNNNHLLNLEMQMTNQYNWQDRSLSYLCRSFDQLYRGEEYSEAKPATHIGFLNFTPFLETPEFHTTYKLLNTKNHTVYSDKFSLHMVDLTHIELATKEDKAWKIDYWARLFTATTWEDVKMITENDIHMKDAAEKMYELGADEIIQQRCRARNDYMKQINTHNRTLRELEEVQKELDISQKNLDSVHKELDIAHNELNLAHNELNLAHNEIEQLKKRIAELETQQK